MRRRPPTASQAIRDWASKAWWKAAAHPSQAAFVSNLGGSATPAMPGDSGQWLLLGDEQGPLAWFGLDDRLRSDAPRPARRLQGARLAHPPAIR